MVMEFSSAGDLDRRDYQGNKIGAFIGPSKGQAFEAAFFAGHEYSGDGMIENRVKLWQAEAADSAFVTPEEANSLVPWLSKKYDKPVKQSVIDLQIQLNEQRQQRQQLIADYQATHDVSTAQNILLGATTLLGAAASVSDLVSLVLPEFAIAKGASLSAKLALRATEGAMYGIAQEGFAYDTANKVGLTYGVNEAAQGVAINAGLGALGGAVHHAWDAVRNRGSAVRAFNITDQTGTKIGKHIEAREARKAKTIDVFDDDASKIHMAAAQAEDDIIEIYKPTANPLKTFREANLTDDTKANILQHITDAANQGLQLSVDMFMKLDPSYRLSTLAKTVDLDDAIKVTKSGDRYIAKAINEGGLLKDVEIKAKTPEAAKTQLKNIYEMHFNGDKASRAEFLDGLANDKEAITDLWVDINERGIQEEHVFQYDELLNDGELQRLYDERIALEAEEFVDTEAVKLLNDDIATVESGIMSQLDVLAKEGTEELDRLSSIERALTLDETLSTPAVEELLNIAQDMTRPEKYYDSRITYKPTDKASLAAEKTFDELKQTTDALENYTPAKVDQYASNIENSKLGKDFNFRQIVEDMVDPRSSGIKYSQVLNDINTRINQLPNILSEAYDFVLKNVVELENAMDLASSLKQLYPDRPINAVGLFKKGNKETIDGFIDSLKKAGLSEPKSKELFNKVMSRLMELTPEKANELAAFKPAEAMSKFIADQLNKLKKVSELGETLGSAEKKTINIKAPNIAKSTRIKNNVIEMDTFEAKEFVGDAKKLLKELQQRKDDLKKASTDVKLGEEFSAKTLIKDDIRKLDRELQALSSKYNFGYNADTGAMWFKSAEDRADALLSKQTNKELIREETLVEAEDTTVAATEATVASNNIATLEAAKLEVEKLNSPSYKVASFLQQDIIGTLMDVEKELLIEKRNTLLAYNLQVDNFFAFTTRDEFVNNPMRALNSLLSDTLEPIKGSALNVENIQKLGEKKIAQLSNRLRTAGQDVYDFWHNKDNALDIKKAFLAKKRNGNVDFFDESVSREANVAAKLYMEMELEVNAKANKVGCYLEEVSGLMGWDRTKIFYAKSVLDDSNPTLMKKIKNAIDKQSTDYDANKEAFINYLLTHDLLDEERTFNSKGINSLEAKRELVGTIFDDVAIGPSARAGLFGGGKLTGTRSPSERLVFKDDLSEIEFNKLFGFDNVDEAADDTFRRTYRNIGLMEKLGPEPHAALEGLWNNLVDFHKGKSSARDFERPHHKEQLKAVVSNLDGTTSTPGRGFFAHMNTVAKVMNTMKLGGVALDSLQDYFNGLQLLLYNGLGHGSVGKITKEYIDFVKLGYSEEGKILAEQLAIVNDAFKAKMHNTFDLSSTVNKAAQGTSDFIMSKINFLKPMTEGYQKGFSLCANYQLAHVSQKAWDTLDAEAVRTLQRYGFTSEDWSVLNNIKPVNEVDVLKKLGYENRGNAERIYMSSELLEQIPNDEFKTLVKKATGTDLSDAAVISYKNKLASKMDIYTISNAHAALTIPNAKSMSYINFGLNSGSILGQTMSNITQFKSFPIAHFRQNWGRVVSGNMDVSARRSLFDHIMSGDMWSKGNVVNIGAYAAGLALIGSMTGTVKDILLGKTPREISSDPHYLMSVVDRTGIMPIIGSLMVDTMDPNVTEPFDRFISGLLGPTAGTTTRLFDKARQPYAREGYTTEENAYQSALNVASFALDNQPLNNSVAWSLLSRMLFVDAMQEALQVNTAQDREDKLEKRTGQTYWYPHP